MSAGPPLQNVAVGVASFTLVSALTVGAAVAQSAKSIAGDWTPMSIVTVQGSQTVEPFGKKPQGVLTLGESGRYSLVIVRSDMPKFVSNNRSAGTAEENRAVVDGSIAHFGTYSVDGTNLIFRIEAATFPNWNGAEQKRPFTLAGDELTYVVPAASGGGTGRLVWKRITKSGN